MTISAVVGWRLLTFLVTCVTWRHLQIGGSCDRMVYNKLFIFNIKTQKVKFVVMMGRLLPLTNTRGGWHIIKHGQKKWQVIDTPWLRFPFIAGDFPCTDVVPRACVQLRWFSITFQIILTFFVTDTSWLTIENCPYLSACFHEKEWPVQTHEDKIARLPCVLVNLFHVVLIYANLKKKNIPNWLCFTCENIPPKIHEEGTCRIVDSKNHQLLKRNEAFISPRLRGIWKTLRGDKPRIRQRT
jgi:hypothetical protein